MRSHAGRKPGRGVVTACAALFGEIATHRTHVNLSVLVLVIGVRRPVSKDSHVVTDVVGALSMHAQVRRSIDNT